MTNPVPQRISATASGFDLLRKVLYLAAVTETGVGLALLVVPAIVVKLLLGVETDGTALLLARCFGICLLALEFACWPDSIDGIGGARVLGALLTYNLLFALYLAYIGVIGGPTGVLLWPAVAFHAAGCSGAGRDSARPAAGKGEPQVSGLTAATQPVDRGGKAAQGRKTESDAALQELIRIGADGAAFQIAEIFALLNSSLGRIKAPRARA